MIFDLLADYPFCDASDYSSNAGRAKSLVVFAPAYEAVFDDQFDEVVIPPTCIATCCFGTTLTERAI